MASNPSITPDALFMSHRQAQELIDACNKERMFGYYERYFKLRATSEDKDTLTHEEAMIVLPEPIGRVDVHRLKAASVRLEDFVAISEELLGDENLDKFTYGSKLEEYTYLRCEQRLSHGKARMRILGIHPAPCS